MSATVASALRCDGEKLNVRHCALQPSREVEPECSRGARGAQRVPLRLEVCACPGGGELDLGMGARLWAAGRRKAL